MGGADREQGRIQALDGVRGIAILAVMLRHFVQEMDVSTAADRVVYGLGRLGSNGVDLFFVLSGFLITGILLDAKGRADYYKRFYIRRTLRIFPLYYLALCIAFWMWPLLPPASSLLYATLENQGWYWLYASNWLFVKEGTYLGLAHFWSLAIEEQFYLVWPAVVAFVSRERLPSVCAWCFALSLALRAGLALAGVDVMIVYVLTPARFDSLALGALIAAVAREEGGPRRLRKAAAWLGPLSAVALVGMVVAGGTGGRTHLLMTVGVSLVGVMSGAMVVWAVFLPDGAFGRRLFENRLLRWLGFYAYALYVFHPFVQDAIERVWRDDLLPRVGGSLLPGRAVFILACLSASSLVAWASWHAYEKHWLALKDRWTGRGAVALPPKARAAGETG
ncbi:MAG: acyltransferase [Thermoanaerobaculia bacterium]|nr:acyltransferase [Thermoanaerobaculia bacterium]